MTYPYYIECIELNIFFRFEMIHNLLFVFHKSIICLECCEYERTVLRLDERVSE